MTTTKYPVKGKLGKTVVYTLNNLQVNGNTLTWSAFRFYTPVGTQTDENGKYFDVPAGEIDITRHETLDWELIIKIDQQTGIDPYQVYEGAESPPMRIGLEGDIIITGHIPANPQEEINIEYKEVTNE